MVVSLVRDPRDAPAVAAATATPAAILGLTAVGAALRRRRHVGHAQPQPADRAADDGAAAGRLPLPRAAPGIRAPGGRRRGRQRRPSRRWRSGGASRRSTTPGGSTRWSSPPRCPRGVLVVVFLVRDAYKRLREQSDQLAESRTRIVEVADAARRSLERDLHDGAQQRLLAMSVTIERARKELAAGRTDAAAALLGQLAADNREVAARAARARPRHLPAAAHRARPGRRAPVGRRRSPVPVTLDVADFERPEPAGRGGGVLLHPRGADQRRQALRRHRGAGHRARAART